MLPFVLRRKLFLVLPLLLSRGGTFIRSRGDFKQMRNHIALLSERNYFLDSLEWLKKRAHQETNLTQQQQQNQQQQYQQQQEPQGISQERQDEERDRKRIRTLASRGLFTKIPLDDSTSVCVTPSPSQLSAVHELFPVSPLPEPLPFSFEDPRNVVKLKVETGEIISAIRSLKRGKASGLNGWTRELLLPLISDSPPEPFVVFPAPDRCASCPDLLGCTERALSKMFGKLDARLLYLKTAPASKQVMFLTIRSLIWFHVYHVGTLPDSNVSKDIVKKIDVKILLFLTELLGLELHNSSHHVPFFTPVEDGGLGVVPLSILRPKLANEILGLSNNLLKEIGLTPYPSVASEQTVNYIWRDAMKSISACRNTTLPTDYKSAVSVKCWLDTWPSSHLTSLSDEEFVFAIRYRMGEILPFPHICRLSADINLLQLSPAEVWEHVESCRSCGGIFNHIRHEKVNNALHSIFRRNGLVSELNPIGLPVPGNDRGGPDFLLIQGSKIFAGDVSITRSRTSDAYKRKLRQYEEFAESTGFIPFPFILSTRGLMDRGTMYILKTIARDVVFSGFVIDCCVLPQFELIRGLFAAMRISRARFSLTHFSPDPQNLVPAALPSSLKLTPNSQSPASTLCA